MTKVSLLLTLLVTGCSHTSTANNLDQIQETNQNPTIKTETISPTEAEKAFREIIDADTPVEKIAGNFEFTEGPLWHPDGFLLFSDIPANTLFINGNQIIKLRYFVNLQETRMGIHSIAKED